MATGPVQAPFYVPRPPEAAVWIGQSDSSSIIQILSSQKMFGQGGQVPAKQWRYDLTPEPNWLGTPLRSEIMRQLAHQTFFGRPGQAPTKLWRWDYNQDQGLWSAPMSMMSNADTANLPKGNPFHIQWRYDYDSGASFWLGTALNSQ